MTCVFCTEVHGAGDLLFEDARAWLLLHPDWSPRGHAMVVAKRHVENASGLDEDEWLHVARIWHRAERVLLEVTGADRVIVMKLGIQTPHLHVHLYPFAKDANREEVFAAIDGKRAWERDEEWLRGLRSRLTAALA